MCKLCSNLAHMQGVAAAPQIGDAAMAAHRSRKLLTKGRRQSSCRSLLMSVAGWLAGGQAGYYYEYRR